MGPPGAGKGTQAEMLAQKIGYHRFSTGDAFRTISQQDTELGKRVKETIDNGYLAPPEMAAEVVTEAVKKHIEAGKGLIFDGSPRTVQEAKIIDDFFTAQGYGHPLAIHLEIDREDMEARNIKRKFCLDIQGDFPIVTPKDEERCHQLGGRIGVRPDDEPEKIATRWNEFMKNTHPVIARYTAEGIAREVDGKVSVPEVHEQVMTVINQYERD